MNEQKQIPSLRFPEFSGEWENNILGEIATFSKGKNISKNDIDENGIIECVRYGELYTTYQEVIDTVVSKTNLPKEELVFSKANDVIIPSSGETQLDIATASCVVNEGIALSGDLNIIRTKNNGVFTAFYLNNKRKKDIAALAQGNSVVHLYNHHLKSLQLLIPSLPEQQKIAAFLTAVDKKIEQLQQKKSLLEQYKKGMMQKLFSQEIRFKDEEGNEYPDWEEKKLGEVSEIKRGASPRPISSSKWFDENSKIGWVRISDVTSSNITLKTTTQYLSNEGVKKSRYVESGNIIMSICATIGKPVFTGFNVCIHDGFVVFENLTTEKMFLYYLLQKIEKKWYKYGQLGIQLNLNSDIVNSEKVQLPCNEEQTKIANFLSAIDAKIELVNTQIENTQEFKKGLLQKMFV